MDVAGRPTTTSELSTDAGTIASLAFSQSDPLGRSLVWNQRLQLAMGYGSGTRMTPLWLNAARVEVEGARGVPRPLWILSNGEGVGYGQFRLDAASKSFFLAHLPDVGDAFTRGTAWITLWDDMLDAATPPMQIIDLALRALPLEREEQNSQRFLSDLSEAY